MEQLLFLLLGLFVGREYFLFVLFQFGRDVAFRILERLLANEITRDLVTMQVSDF